jgi:hypothetical protein
LGPSQSKCGPTFPLNLRRVTGEVNPIDFGVNQALAEPARSRKNRETIKPVASSTKFETPLLAILFLALVLIEAVILEAFLPYKWAYAIQHQIDRVFPREPYEPHPDMGWEIELDLQQHPLHRGIVYSVSAILALGNAYLIVKVWKALAHSKAQTARD